MNILDNLFNLKYLGKSNISLSKAVLIFYLVIGNNYTGELFSGQLTDFIRSNRYAQHVIGYLTMMTIINSIGGVTNVQRTAVYSLIAYLWFTFTTKLDLRWSFLLIGFMVMGLLYESQMVDKEVRSEDDEALEEQDKEKIRNKHNKMKTAVVIAIMLVTFIGVWGYFNKKKVQYGGNFDGMKFIFQAPKCYRLVK